MYVVNYDKAFAQAVELFSVICDCLIAYISMGVEQFSGSPNAGSGLYDFIDFSLPAASKLAIDNVFACDLATGLQVK